MEIKDYLMKPTRLYQKIKKNEDCAAHWHRMASTVSAPAYDRERVAASRNTNAPFVAPLEKAIDLERVIQRQYGELAELKREVTAVIYLLEDPLAQLVLLNRYIRLMDWEDVLMELSLPRASMFRMHREALKELEVKINAT